MMGLIRRRGDPRVGIGRISVKVRRSYHLVSIVCGVLLVAAGPSAKATTDAVSPAAAPRIVFDIPAQPLAAALYAYSAATAVEVVADGALVSGRRSAALKGAFTPEGALRDLLVGTGLTLRRTAANAFVLVPVATAAPADPLPTPAFADYSTLIQTAMKEALCRVAATQPGGYRTAVQLWIAPSGAVVKAALLSSTGNDDRDTMLSAMLRGLTIGAPPPRSLPQPVTLVILPRSPAETGDCRPASAN
jgi:hypothetical protein